MHRFGLNAQQQGVKPCHHQTLNVVRIAMRQGLRDGVAQAGHVGLAGPVKLGQWRVGLHGIALSIVGHVRPINAAHVLTPAQDLAHKTLHCLEGRVALAKRILCRRDHLPGVEQLQIQSAGQMRVVEPQLALPHRILVQAKAGQPVGDEVGQGR